MRNNNGTHQRFVGAMRALPFMKWFIANCKHCGKRGNHGGLPLHGDCICIIYCDYSVNTVIENIGNSNLHRRGNPLWLPRLRNVIAPVAQCYCCE